MIRRILLASACTMALTGAVLAAEPVPPPPPPPYVPLPWTGFYIGLNAGYTWSNDVRVDSTSYPLIFDAPGGAYEAALERVGTASLPVKNDGFLGGIQVGYNFEFPNHSVASLEGDIQGVVGAASSATGTSFTPVGVIDNYTTHLAASNKLDFLGTLRGRYGYLFTPNLLVFGSGGFAFGGISTSASFLATETLGFPPVFGGDSLSTTDVGWAAGGGFEWEFLPHWTFKVEYLYYMLAKETASFGYLTQNVPGVPLAFAAALTHFTITPQGSIVRAGINYLFTTEPPPAVVAKY
jgi:outer membrane immunogenic protein